MGKNIQFSEAGHTVACIAAGVGIGLVAGLVGTAVMTAAQMIEMKITGREASDAPYRAVRKTFGVQARSQQDKARVNNIAHFAYGTSWGIPRGVMASFGMNGATGTAAHMAAVWGTELTVIPAMDVIEPVTEWEPKALGTDAVLHGIYAVAAGLTADLLAKWLDR